MVLKIAECDKTWRVLPNLTIGKEALSFKDHMSLNLAYQKSPVKAEGVEK